MKTFAHHLLILDLAASLWLKQLSRDSEFWMQMAWDCLVNPPLPRYRWTPPVT